MFEQLDRVTSAIDDDWPTDVDLSDEEEALGEAAVLLLAIAGEMRDEVMRLRLRRVTAELFAVIVMLRLREAPPAPRSPVEPSPRLGDRHQTGQPASSSLTPDAVDGIVEIYRPTRMPPA